MGKNSINHLHKNKDQAQANISSAAKTNRAALDVIGKYESDSVGGYNAVNQVGTNNGRGVLGYSGDIRSMKQHGGKALTDFTVAEIMDLQNNSGQYASMSNQEWIEQDYSILSILLEVIVLHS